MNEKQEDREPNNNHESPNGIQNREDHENNENGEISCPQCYYEKPEEQNTEGCPQCYYEREEEQIEEPKEECPQCHYKGRVVEKVHRKGSPQGFYGNR